MAQGSLAALAFSSYNLHGSSYYCNPSSRGPSALFCTLHTPGMHSAQCTHKHGWRENSAVRSISVLAEDPKMGLVPNTYIAYFDFL